MATSSILENIRVNNPKAVEEFVAAMEASNFSVQKQRSQTSVTTDPDKIRNLMRKGLQNRGR